MTRPLEIRYKAKRFRVNEFAERLRELPKKFRRPALLVYSKYMLKQFRLYPRYRYVSRRSAYPEVDGFFSDKQRRFVMAKIASGEIRPGSPHRTQALKDDWRIEGESGRDIQAISLVNSNPAAVFAYHPIYQARQLDLVGWKDVNEMTEENANDALLEVEVWIANNVGQVVDETLK